MGMKLCVIVPTRHRAELAIAAIRSLLAEKHAELTVIVSDNSSREEDVQLLAEFCRTTADPRLIYIRPPEVLAMPAHWNWALEQAMARTDATHFGMHYDRKVFKAGAITRLTAACAYDPSALVTYTCDFTIAQDGGFAAWQYPGTGKLYEIRTATVVRRFAAGTVHDLGQAFPLLSNCMVPRPLLERVRALFGNICDSNAPDLSFFFRFAAVEARYLHFDAGLSVMYTFRLSNGQGYYRRDTDGTFGDFMKLWGGRPWLDAAPIPGLNLGINIAFHEYNLVRQIAGETAFPPIQMDGYLRELGKGLALLTDEGERAELRAILENHGWHPEPPPKPRPAWRRIAGRLVRPLRRIVRGRRNELDPDRRFATEEESVDYLLNHRLPPVAHNPLLTILDPVELASPR
jgi:glycosyltransferase involved in cell wall biosynthesis